MTSSEQSFTLKESSDEEFRSEEDFQTKTSWRNSMQLRKRNTKTYNEFENHENLEVNEKKALKMNYQTRQTHTGLYKKNQFSEYTSNINEKIEKGENNLVKLSGNENFKKENYIYDNQDNLSEVLNDNYDESKVDDQYYEEQGGVFYPDIDAILWRKEELVKEENDEKMKTMYLVKYKGYSYLHTEWLEEEEIIGNSKLGKNKLNRFNKLFNKKLFEMQFDMDFQKEETYFDQSYLEVDKVLYTTELFPVIHPKKTSEMKGKWSEFLVVIFIFNLFKNVVSNLLNYSKDNVHYGVYFMEPVNPEKEGVPHYKNELGLVFKNYKDSDIRILCDTLREIVIVLYKQWYQNQKVKK